MAKIWIHVYFWDIKIQINKQNTQNAMWIIDCRNAFCLQTVSKSIQRSHTHTQSSSVMCLVLLALSRFLSIECKFKMQLMRNGKLIFLVMLLSLEATASSIGFDSSFYVSRLFVFNAPVLLAICGVTNNECITCDNNFDHDIAMLVFKWLLLFRLLINFSDYPMKHINSFAFMHIY